MSIRLLIGRAGSGKSTRCLDEIRERLRQHPDGNPLILLVPEQATFQAEYSLVSTPDLHGVMRAQVLSFRRLAWRIMQETGGTARVHIDDSGKKMLLFHILHHCREQLKLFHSSMGQMGFIEKLSELFNEFRRYGITSIKLEEMMQGQGLGTANKSPLFTDKLHDMTLVYGRFEAELAKLYVDSEDYLTMLAQQIEHSPYAKAAEIWIDGFHGFTPQELLVLEKLIQHTSGVTMAICADRNYSAAESPEELDLFHPTAITLVKLNRMIENLGLSWEETVVLGQFNDSRYVHSPMLAHLERHFGDAHPTAYRSSPQEEGSPSLLPAQISIHATVNRRAEVEGVAREMIRLVRDTGVRWRDMALMVRNYEGYSDLVATTFADYGIPHFFDQKRSMLHHPLIEFIRSALEVIDRNWRYDAVFRCVKTGFLPPLHREDESDPLQLRHAMDQLENYVLAFGIQGSRWTDGKPWAYRLRVSLEDDAADQASEMEQQVLHNVNRWRAEIVQPMLAFQQAMRKAATVRDMAGALYGLLETIGAAHRLELWSEQSIQQGRAEKAREHTQIWGQVLDLLDQIVEMMGDNSLSIELFANVVETGLESIRLGLVPPALDQVLIGSMDRTRPSHIQYCFVLGANDGVMPAAMSESGVLAESERERLTNAGLEMADGSRRKLLDEQFLMYTAFLTPSRHLWISYPLADEEGKSLLPSEIIRRMKATFPSIQKQLLLSEPLVDLDAGSQFAFIVKPERALSYLTAQLREWKKGIAIEPLWWHVYNWFCTQDSWRDKLSMMVSAIFYANRDQSLERSTSLLLYGDNLKASVSRMERFVSCPFSQFVSHGLRLQERHVFRLDAPDIGQLFHAALSMFADQLIRDHVLWGDLTEEQCRIRASAIVDLLAPRLQGEILLSSKRFHYIARKLKMVIGRAATVLGAQARRGQFTPIGLELGFGPGQTLPPLTFKLDNGSTMEIVGRIDRVDRAEGEQGVLLRVIDYKSSRTSLNLSEVYYGLSLQMLTYLDVVITHAERWIGQQSTPAGVLYFHVHNPLLQSKNALDAATIEEQLFKQYKLRGLVLADPEVVRLMDGNMREKNGHSDIVPVGLKADGTFYKNSSVVEPQQWDKLRGYVRKVIQRIGTDITNGNVDIAPYRMGNKSPCTYCSYKPVCQFDRLLEGNGYRVMDSMSKDEVLQQIGGEGK